MQLFSLKPGERIEKHYLNQTDGTGYTSLSPCVYVCACDLVIKTIDHQRVCAKKSPRLSKLLSILLFTHKKKEHILPHEAAE